MKNKQHQKPLSVSEQIENLKSLGLIIENEEEATSFLNDVSYFRVIKAYSLDLKPCNGNYNKGVTFNMLNENPRDITLYAKWDLAIYYDNFENMSNLNAMGDRTRVVVDWSDYKALGTYYPYGNITVNSSINEIYFIGSCEATYTNININLDSSKENEDTLLTFDNFNIVGKLCGLDNVGNINVTLVCKGENSIQAFYGDNAICGYNLLTVEGDGTLTVFGYDGLNATEPGVAGDDGGTAIVVNHLVVNMSGCLTVIGGRGGDGKSGSDGLPASSYDSNAGDGTFGGNGGTGGDGGNGGNTGWQMNNGSAGGSGGATGKAGTEDEAGLFWWVPWIGDTQYFYGNAGLLAIDGTVGNPGVNVNE